MSDKDNRAAELRKQIDALESTIDAMSGDVKAMKSELAELLSPFKIGDIIEWKRGKTKARGRVTGVTFWIGRDCQWQVTTIRKDNTDGASVLVPPYYRPTLAV